MPILRQIAHLGQPVLRAKAAAVVLPVDDLARRLAADLLATMREAEGVGIAAPQVHESLALFIMASAPNSRYPDAPLMEPEVVINPEVLDRSAEIVKGWKGCLSIPGLRGEVPRHQSVVVRYHTLDGRRVERELSGFVARIFQHEDDHLHGIVFLDRLESTLDLITEREFRRRETANP